LVSVAAGEDWDEFVARAVAADWIGVEALSGIPGAVGETPIQNVGAYGQEVADTLWTVRAYDEETGAVRTFANSERGFGYCTKRFKGTDRYVILTVTYQLLQGTLS